MIDQIIEKVIEQGGIWCALCVYMILYTNKKYNSLEKEVRDRLSGALDANTAALQLVKETIENANKNRS